MNELGGESMNLIRENIKSLKKLFPEAVSEGNVDYNMLKELLGEEAVYDKEKYGLNWNGKREAFRGSLAPSKGTLRPVEKDSVNWDNTENLYIEGDNLEVLKLLQKAYFEKIKMIYIDPPYNRDGDFLYKDDYSQSIENYMKLTQQVDVDGYTLTANREYSGRYHTDWLNMMYPRLRLAKKLLCDDGVIFISIDAVEQANLRKICDEVFGEDNFVAVFVWEKTQHFGRQKLNTYNNLDYVLCYAKNLFGNSGLKQLLVEEVHGELEDAPLFNASNPVNTLVFPKGSTKFNINDGVYENTTSDKYVLKGPVTVKNGVNENEFSLTFNSRWNPEKIIEEYNNGTTYWVKSENFAVRAIYHESKTTKVSLREMVFTNTKTGMAATNRFGVSVGTSESATAELRDLFGESPFDYPKPVSLIEYFIASLYDYKSDSYSKDFTVLDFFSGSSTTASAVIKLNATDGGRRKFIMVQIPEEVKEGSTAYKMGYKFIPEIAKERIRLSGTAIKKEFKEKYEKQEDGNMLASIEALDIGFKVLKLDTSNIKAWNPQQDEDINTVLKGSIDPYIKGRSDEDIVYELMLKLGVKLTSKVEEITSKTGSIYSIDSGSLMICLADNITEDTATKMGELYKNQSPPSWQVVFRDEGFKSDSMKINIKQMLKAKGLAEEAFNTL